MLHFNEEATPTGPKIACFGSLFPAGATSCDSCSKKPPSENVTSRDLALSDRGLSIFIAEVANAVTSVHSNHPSSATPRGSLDHSISSASKLEETASGSGRTRPPRVWPPPPLIDLCRPGLTVSACERRRGSPACRNAHSRETRTPESRWKTGRPILR